MTALAYRPTFKSTHPSLTLLYLPSLRVAYTHHIVLVRHHIHIHTLRHTSLSPTFALRLDSQPRPQTGSCSFSTLSFRTSGQRSSSERFSAATLCGFEALSMPCSPYEVDSSLRPTGAPQGMTTRTRAWSSIFSHAHPSSIDTCTHTRSPFDIRTHSLHAQDPCVVMTSGQAARTAVVQLGESKHPRWR